MKEGLGLGFWSFAKGCIFGIFAMFAFNIHPLVYFLILAPLGIFIIWDIKREEDKQ